MFIVFCLLDEQCIPITLYSLIFGIIIGEPEESNLVEEL